MKYQYFSTIFDFHGKGPVQVSFSEKDQEGKIVLLFESDKVQARISIPEGTVIKQQGLEGEEIEELQEFAQANTEIIDCLFLNFKM